MVYKKTRSIPVLLALMIFAVGVFFAGCTGSSKQQKVKRLPYQLDAILGVRDEIASKMEQAFQKCGENGKESRFTKYQGRLFQFDNLSWEIIVEGRDYLDSEHLNDISFRGAVKLIPLKEVPAEETRQVPYREYDYTKRKWLAFEPFGFIEGAMVEVTKKGTEPVFFVSAYAPPSLPCTTLLSEQPLAKNEGESAEVEIRNHNIKQDSLANLTRTTRPQILYKEKARYTLEAKENQVQGEVLLSVIFSADGQITGIEVLKGLPYGLTESAIEAAQKIRFQPASKDGQAVSVRGTLAYGFTLY